MASQSDVKKKEYTQYIPPKGEFETFQDETHYKEKLKEWGLSSAAKKEFWYKDRAMEQQVTIKGFEVYGNTGDGNTIVIEFQDGNLSCIHPAFLKEMQSSSFSKGSMWEIEDRNSESIKSKETDEKKETGPANESSPKNVKKESVPKSEKPKEKSKKEKAPKITLPTDKVHFTASVKQFALTYNPFNEENDEVVVLENVQVQQETPLDIGYSWCSHSKTLKKYELSPGDLLEFDGKIVAKKLAKGKDVEEEYIVEVPVAYKINNPSKIVKK